MAHHEFRPVDARALAERLERFDVPLPEPLALALAVIDATQKVSPPSGPVLHLSEAEVRARVEDLALHWTGEGRDIGTARGQVADQAAREAADELRAGAIDDVIVSLRPRFDKAADVYHQAVALGFTQATTAADVVRRGADVLEVFNALPRAYATLASISGLRIDLSVTLGIAPTRAEVAQVDAWAASRVAVEGLGNLDYSVAFAAGDNWSTSGAFNITHTTSTQGVASTVKSSGLDWFKLATGGLRLNTGGEVIERYAKRSAASVAA